MARRKKTFSPGIVFQRGSKLYIKMENKQYSTKLNATKEGWAKAELIKNTMYENYLRTRSLVPEVQKTTTVYEVFEEFLNALNKKNRSRNTIRGYKLALKSIVSTNLVLNKIEIKKAVDEFIETRKDISNSSINIYLHKFQIFINFCIKREYLPFVNIYTDNIRDTPIKEVSPHTEEELQQIINELENPSILGALPDHEFALLIQFLSNTGSRIKEALELKWDDIDFDNSIIKFRNKINKTKIDLFPISNPVLKILKEMQKISKVRRGTDKIAKLFRWEETSSSRLSRRLANIESILGFKISGQCFHRFRNTFSNRIIDANLQLLQVRDLMRHKDIRTTLNHYKKYDAEKLRTALNSLQ
jgi:integrase